MSQLPVQSTRLQGVLQRLRRQWLGWLRRSWRSASLAILALLLGYWLGQNFTSLLLERVPLGRPAAVLAMVLLFEAMVRLRSRLVKADPPPAWVFADNLRIGLSYSVVLEAFKLGT